MREVIPTLRMKGKPDSGDKVKDYSENGGGEKASTDCWTAECRPRVEPFVQHCQCDPDGEPDEEHDGKAGGRGEHVKSSRRQSPQDRSRNRPSRGFSRNP